MNQISKYFSFVLAVLFFIQANAWASMTVSSDEIRRNYLAAMQSRPQNDKDFMKSQKVEERTFPSVKDGVFYLEKKKIVVKVHSPTWIEINGKKFDFSPGNLEKTATEIEQHLYPHKVGLLDFIVPSAHAGLFIGIGAAIVGTAVAVAWTYYEHDQRSLTKRHCTRYRREVARMKNSGSTEEITKLQDDYQNEIWKIISYYPECRQTNGSQKDGSQCKAHYAHIDCLENAKRELENLKAVNTSGREMVKEVEENKSSSKKTSNAKAQ